MYTVLEISHAFLLFPLACIYAIQICLVSVVSLNYDWMET